MIKSRVDENRIVNFSCRRRKWVGVIIDIQTVGFYPAISGIYKQHKQLFLVALIRNDKGEIARKRILKVMSDKDFKRGIPEWDTTPALREFLNIPDDMLPDGPNQVYMNTDWYRLPILTCAKTAKWDELFRHAEWEWYRDNILTKKKYTRKSLKEIVDKFNLDVNTALRPIIDSKDKANTILRLNPKKIVITLVESEDGTQFKCTTDIFISK